LAGMPDTRTFCDLVLWQESRPAPGKNEPHV
jgi:hypothetical protein